MYFMVNTAFINYLDQINNLTESLEFLLLKNKTTFEQMLPISLNISKFDSELLTVCYGTITNTSLALQYMIRQNV